MIDMERKYRTADGRDVRILAKDMKNRDGYTVVGIVTKEDGTEFAMQWKDDGTCWNGGYRIQEGEQRNNKELDLVLVPTKHEGWIIVLGCYDVNFLYDYIFMTKQGAEDWLHTDTRTGHVIRIEWED